MFPAGCSTALVLSVAWPLAMIARHGTGALRSGRCTCPTAWQPIRRRSPASRGGSTCRASDPGDALDAAGGRRGLVFAPPRRRRSRTRRARFARPPPAVVERATGCSGHGRPRRWPCSPRDGEERELRDRRAGALVDLGGAGPVATRGTLVSSRLDAPRLRRAAVAGSATLGLAYGLGFGSGPLAR